MQHNPYNCIRQAEFFLLNPEIDKAKKILEQGITICGSNEQRLYPLYFKLFEVSMESGHALQERFNKAIINIVSFGQAEYKKNNKYKEDAEKYLKIAVSSINKEIEYIKNLNMDGDGDFFSHLNSRLNCLNVYSSNMEELLEELLQNSENGCVINSRIENYFQDLEDSNPHEKEIKDNTKKEEINELKFIGLDNIYRIGKVYDVPEYVLNIARANIIAGVIGILSTAIPVIGGVSTAGMSFYVSLIYDGVMDIVLNLVAQIEDGTNKKDYEKGKLIDYGLMVVTFGVDKIANSTKVLNNCLKVTKKLPGWFKKSKFGMKMQAKIAGKIKKLKVPDKLIKPKNYPKNPAKELFKEQICAWLAGEGEALIKKELTKHVSDLIPEELSNTILKFKESYENKTTEIANAVFEELKKNLIKEEVSSDSLEEHKWPHKVFYEVFYNIANDVFFEISRGYHLVATIYSYVENLIKQGGFNVVFKTIKDIFNKHKLNLADIKNVFDLKEAFEGVKSKISEFVQKVKDILKILSEGVDGIINRIKSYLENKKNQIENALKNVIKEIKDVTFTKVLSSYLHYFIEYLKDTFKTFFTGDRNPIYQYLIKIGINISSKEDIKNSLASKIVDICFHFLKNFIKSKSPSAKADEALISIADNENDCTFRAVAALFGFTKDQISNNFMEIQAKISFATGVFLGPRGASINEIKLLIDILLNNKKMSVRQSKVFEKPFSDKPKKFLSEHKDASMGIGFFKGSCNHAMNIVHDKEPYVIEYTRGNSESSPKLEHYNQAICITITPFKDAKEKGKKLIEQSQKSQAMTSFITGEQGGDLFGAEPLSSIRQEECFINYIFKKNYVKIIEIFTKVAEQASKAVSIIIKTTDDIDKVTLEIEDYLTNKAIKAFCSPYTGKRENATWDNLRETFIHIDKSSGITKYACSGPFEGCTLILIIASDWAGMLHDAAPLINIQNKYNGIAAQYGNNIRLIRVDEETNRYEIERSHENLLPFPVECLTYPRTIISTSDGLCKGQRTMFFLRDCMDNTGCQLARCTGTIDPYDRSQKITCIVDNFEIKNINYHTALRATPQPG